MPPTEQQRGQDGRHEEDPHVEEREIGLVGEAGEVDLVEEAHRQDPRVHENHGVDLAQRQHEDTGALSQVGFA